MSESTESKTAEKNPSVFEKIFLRIIQPIFLSLGVSVFSGYLILQLPYNLNITAYMVGTVVFIAAFKFFYKKVKNDVWARPSRDISDFTPSDLSNPENPFSFTTPGGPLYMSGWSDRDHFNENKSAFSDSDNYQNR